MKRMLLGAVLAGLCSLLFVGAGAWALGVVDPLVVFHDDSPEGSFRLEGSIEIDGTGMELPFVVDLDLPAGGGDPQLRYLSIGDKVEFDVPAVMRRAVVDSLGGGSVIRLLGEAARLRLEGVEFGFWVDKFKVTLKASTDLKIPNPNSPSVEICEGGPCYPEDYR